MLRRGRGRTLLAICGCTLSAVATAQGPPASSAAPRQLPAAQSERPVLPLGPVNIPAPIVTRHVGRFNGHRVNYDAFVEPIVVKDAKGRPGAQLVTISYVGLGTNPATRPVLFVFNGGPIMPTIPLHLGAFGPRRVAVPNDVHANLANLPLVDNVHAPLDFADVVIFDVANTGYSRTLAGVRPESYFSVTADGQQLAQLVLEWSRRHGRVASPKYLVGESYGTLRAPEAAAQLQDTDMPVSGIMLFGQAVNIHEYAQRSGNIVSYAVSLPTLAAIAWSHNRADRRGRTFEQFIREAEDYGAGEYLSVLFLGDRAPLERRQAVARRLQEFTGLSADQYLARNLRITKVEYQRLLLPGQILDTNDARYSYPADPKDPSRVAEGTFNLANVWNRALPVYLRDELHVGPIGEYSEQSPVPGNTFETWDWGPNRSPFGDWNYAARITPLFKRNLDFRLFVANGYYDTQTTLGAMDYLVAQNFWPRNRVRTAYYQGGHMFYTVEASLAAMMKDVRAMVTHQW